jgi:ATP-dependent phosphofructokinase / diphosphate-dependent phosphofructokinase
LAAKTPPERSSCYVNGRVALPFRACPKTIDNDLMENDHVPGFISAAAFVANALVSMDLDFRAMPGIYVAIVMGRHAGFLAAAAGWQQSPDDAPNLIYTPEKPFSVVQFLDEVDAVYAGLGRCIVSMSEGVQDEAGRPPAEALAGAAVERDAHGNLQLTGGDLGIGIQKALKSRFPKARARVDTLGYLASWSAISGQCVRRPAMSELFRTTD